jgi:Family of unknown function (DUF6082)
VTLCLQSTFVLSVIVSDLDFNHFSSAFIDLCPASLWSGAEVRRTSGPLEKMESMLSVIATIISSVALIGIAVGLLLQNRQLRTNKIQVMREMHLELMRIGMENPALSASVYEDTNAADFPKSSLLNLILKFWQTGYTLKTITKASVTLQTTRLFGSEYARTSWGKWLQDIYRTEAGTKSEREFFALVDTAYQNVMLALESADRTKIEPSNETNR